MAKMVLSCNECGKKFKVSESNPDPSCPKCGSVDFDVEGIVRKVVYRNYSVGPFDFGPEAA